MWAGFFVGDADTPTTVKEGGEEQGRDAEVGELRKNLLRRIGTVVAPDAGVIPADDEGSTAEILPHDGMEDGVAGPSIPDLAVQGSQHRALPLIVMTHQRVIRPGNDLVFEFARLLAPDHGINDDAVHSRHR